MRGKGYTFRGLSAIMCGRMRGVAFGVWFDAVPPAGFYEGKA